MKKKYTKEDIIKILRSGHFTIVYWDSCDPTLYAGKWQYRKEFEKDDYKRMNKYIIPLDTYDDGYLPNIVSLLTEALGGVADSI